MLFVREFRPIDGQQFSFHLFHLSTEERLQDGGDSACGLWFAVVFCLLGCLCPFSPPSDCFSLPSMMTWAPCPHGVRTRGKKTPCLIFCCQHFVLCWTCFRRGRTIAEAITLICRGGGSTVTVFHVRVVFLRLLLCQGHMSFAMCCFFFVHTVLENAYCLQQRIAPCKVGVETSCGEVRLRKASLP